MKIRKLQQQLRKNNWESIFIDSSSNRRYLSGFTGTFGALFITQEQAFFITDFRYTTQAKEQAVGFIFKENRNVFQEALNIALQLGITTIAFEQDFTTYSRFVTFECSPNVIFIPTIGIVEQLRMYKTSEEINTIRQAVAIADYAFEQILKDLKPGVTELEISNKLDFYMREQGALRPSFEIIVASGYRSALPHGVASTKVIEYGEVVKMDFGALYRGYCSDITRTIAIGSIDSELENVYGIVQEALEIGTKSIQPGVSAKEVDSLVRAFITSQGYGEQFGHGAGHGFGLDVHEQPFMSNQATENLATNMVMTIEPGIYLPGLGGVRIEDDILITENGNEVLSHASRELLIL